VIMAANDGERKAARPSASPACRLELAAVSSPVVGLGLALARRRALRKRSAAGRGVGEPVFVDEAPDGRGHGGELIVGEIDCRHGLAAATAPGVVLCVADGIVRIVVPVVAGEGLGGRLRGGIDRLIGVAAGDCERPDGEDDAEPLVGRLFGRCAKRSRPSGSPPLCDELVSRHGSGSKALCVGLEHGQPSRQEFWASDDACKSRPR
jgi:hypothetical protein